MFSKTKYSVTQEQVRAIFEKAGLGEVLSSRLISSGQFNSLLAVATRQGDFVLKIAPLPGVKVLTHERGLLEQELRFYALLRDRGLRVPEVFFSDRSGTVIPCEYFIMEKLRGTRLDKAKLEKKERERVNAQIEDILALFHGIAGEGFGYEQMGLEHDWYHGLRKMTQALVGDCAAFGRRCRKGELLLRYIDLHRDILKAVPSVLVNFDLHYGNLFYHEGQLAVIDLERCFWGDWIGDCILCGKPETPSKEEQVRYYLLLGYLALISHSEKFSRYRPWGLNWCWNVLYCTFNKCWGRLKKLSR